jgi:hypothetical protein
MTVLFWIVIALLVLDFGMDIFLLIESRKSVREAENEASLAQLMKQDCLVIRKEVVELHKTIMDVINGEATGNEEGRTAAEYAAASADTDPHFIPVSGELPGVGR